MLHHLGLLGMRTNVTFLSIYIGSQKSVRSLGTLVLLKLGWSLSATTLGYTVTASMPDIVKSFIL